MRERTAAKHRLTALNRRPSRLAARVACAMAAQGAGVPVRSYSCPADAAGYSLSPVCILMPKTKVLERSAERWQLLRSNVHLFT